MERRRGEHGQWTSGQHSNRSRFSATIRAPIARHGRRESKGLPFVRRRRNRPETLRQTNGMSTVRGTQADACPTSSGPAVARGALESSRTRRTCRLTEGERCRLAPRAGSLRSQDRGAQRTRHAVRCPSFVLPEQPMGFKTPLYETHVAAGARMVDFGGWDMPVHYGSQIEEHHAVRRDAGMFDVSHMLIADVTRRARARLPALSARERRREAEGSRQGALQLHAQRARRRRRRSDHLLRRREHFRVVVNAGTRDKDIAWLKR